MKKYNKDTWHKWLPVALLLLPLCAWAQPSSSATGMLTGSAVNLRLNANTVSVLKNGTEGLGFYPATSATTVKANTAYVPQPKTLPIDFSSLDHPYTGLKDISQEQVLPTGKAEATYDLSGRHSAASKRGIYVRKGKKISKSSSR